MKAVISNRIYLEADVDLMEQLSSELTYRIPAPIKGQPPTIIKTFGRVNSKVASIPSGRFDLIPKKYEIIDKRVLNPVEFPEFIGELRDSQMEVYEAVNDSCIINAYPSWGKTFTALAIAQKLGQKTLVVTHTTMLRDQWIKEAEKVFPGLVTGIIGSSKYKIDSPIVVANTQTLIKHIENLSSEFGTIILDEAHHTPATTFSNIIDKSKARYKIGLTGTLERKDKKHVIFQDYFGHIVYKPIKENFANPEIIIVESDIIFPGGEFWANRITELETYNYHYQELVSNLADSAAKSGHKVLVVGSRVEFLNRCAELSNRPSTVITGEVKKMEDRQAILDDIGSGKLEIIYGTLSIFAEGISQNDLSCLVLATPINNNPLLTQVIARVCRVKEGKKKPLVIDINLLGQAVKTQQRNRYAYYLSHGYSIRKLKK